MTSSFSNLPYLGSLLFLIFIQDICEQIDELILRFAGDIHCCRNMCLPNQFYLKESNCKVMYVIRRKTAITIDYCVKQTVLESFRIELRIMQMFFYPTLLF
ncbi:hypothetical protein WA026_022338 [Henosepilachna vigintioctopunctata]|uniref:Uncharacterized protein n=1 Tax=Henosepilachna vigintioctopunctata TaxID=420089 RepID=A0AAW1V533_9CUCU